LGFRVRQTSGSLSPGGSTLTISLSLPAQNATLLDLFPGNAKRFYLLPTMFLLSSRISLIGSKFPSSAALCPSHPSHRVPPQNVNSAVCREGAWGRSFAAENGPSRLNDLAWDRRWVPPWGPATHRTRAPGPLCGLMPTWCHPRPWAHTHWQREERAETTSLDFSPDDQGRVQAIRSGRG
jgi:hypothetical protein